MIRRFLCLVVVVASMSAVTSCAQNQDAGSLIQLTSEAGDEYYPSWSPDGTSVVFERTGSSDKARQDVWLMDSDGSRQRKIPTARSAGAPAFSPDGRRVAYVAFQPSEQSPGASVIEVWVMDADGSNAAPLAVESTWIMNFPMWSPDGSQIAYTRCRWMNGPVSSELWIMNADGSGKVQLLTGLDGWLKASWDPGGNRLVFESEGDLWIVNADGTGLRQLTNSQDGRATDPDWSPDGSRIAFESTRQLANGDIQSLIEAIDPDGTGRELVLNSNVNSDWEKIGEPSWSPDGSRIAFAARTTANEYDIWVSVQED